MDYWKEKPASLLLDERITSMTPEELMAWFWLRQRARTQMPPGVLPADQQTLQRWSGLTPRKWREAAPVVLAIFERDSEGRFHDPEIKAAYLDYCRYKHSESVEMARRGNVRWKKKDPDPKFFDPYAKYTMQQHAQALHKQCSSIDQNGDSDSEMRGDAQALHKHAQAMQMQSHRLTDQQVSLKGAESPPAEAAASGPLPPHPPQPPSPPTPKKSTSAFTRPPSIAPDAAERATRTAEHRSVLTAQFAELERQERLRSPPPTPPPASPPPPAPPPVTDPLATSDADAADSAQPA